MNVTVLLEVIGRPPSRILVAAPADCFIWARGFFQRQLGYKLTPSAVTRSAIPSPLPFDAPVTTAVKDQ
jgi:hypothetical protein